MRLSHLSLERFRSYGKQEVALEEDPIHLFVGANGAGKTNLLEAVSVLSLTKSCLGAEEADVITWGEGYFRVRGMFAKDDGETMTAEIVSQLQPSRDKACFLNDVKTGIGEMVGIVPTVAFLPQDLELFSGAPANRRAFLDRLLSQVSPEYLRKLLTYQKLLKQRNALLKHICRGSGREEDLELWDRSIAETGASITLDRLALIEVLQCTLGRELMDLGEDWPDAEIAYLRSTVSRDLLGTQEELLSLLARHRSKDILLQTTSVGPHRDDWSIVVDGRNIATFASRGQQRTAVLALLQLQVSYLELQRGERPIILLDDVFSELDDTHQESLLDSFAEHQTLITATHVPKLPKHAMLWHVDHGAVCPVTAKVSRKVVQDL